MEAVDLHRVGFLEYFCPKQKYLPRVQFRLLLTMVSYFIKSAVSVYT